MARFLRENSPLISAPNLLLSTHTSMHVWRCPSILWSDVASTSGFLTRMISFGTVCSIVYPSIIKVPFRDNCLRYVYPLLAFLMAGGVEGIRRPLVIIIIAGTAIEQAPCVGLLSTYVSSNIVYVRPDAGHHPRRSRHTPHNVEETILSRRTTGNSITAPFRRV